MSRQKVVLEHITPLIITYNEEKNIQRTLDRLLWAKRILIVDSGSTDETISILKNYRQIEVIQHAFVSFADQCNFGLSQISTPWVLSLDADYELSDALVAEIKALQPNDDVAGYRASFVYRIYGRPLRASLYPPRVVLYRRANAIYRNEGHGHRVSVQGTVASLSASIFHDDRKPLKQWFVSQQRYAERETDYLLNTDQAKLATVDRIRLAVWPAPLAVFVYTLLFKGCLLDGWPGWFYTLQRVLAEIMIGLEILNRRLRYEK